MKKIWILHPQGFYPEMVRLLVDEGIQVTYLCADPEKFDDFNALQDDCIKHSFWDAIAGRVPAQVAVDIGVPDPEIIDRLAVSESFVLQMFERMNYAGLSIQDLRRIYFRYIALWSCLLERARPDAVVFPVVPHLGFDYVLYLLCQLRSIETLMFERTYFPDRMFLIDRIEQMPTPPADLCEFGANPNVTEEKERPNYYDDRNRAFEDKRNRRLTKRDFAWDSFKRAVLFVLQVGRRPLSMHKAYGCSMYALAPKMPTRLEYLWRDAVEAIHLYGLRDFYESHTTDPDLSSPYIYYPLQFQPERTSIPMGLGFADQLLGLRLLVECLPPDWHVYVKEHPRQHNDNPVRSSLGRNRQFYESLAELTSGRVRLISVNASSATLLRDSRCVATVAGTAGWEALRAGVPAVVFGAPWYVNCPGVFQVASTAQCKSALGQISSGEALDRSQVQAFTDWMIGEATFPGYLADVFEPVSSLSPAENAASCAKAIAKACRVSEPATEPRAPSEVRVR
jgi:hypothetical protein